MQNVLIVEDDNNLRGALADTLALAGFDCTVAESAEDALVSIQDKELDIVVSDVNLTGMDGHSLLVNLNKNQPDLPVLLMTAYGNIGNAVQAMRDGACDYLIKPFDPEVLVTKVQQYIRQQEANVNDPVFVDPASKELISLAQRVIKTDATVLITGPSGTGKEVLAQYIHNHSERAEKPFVAINCAAIPENMLEATLFGYEKGAFTGAYQASAGKFEQANGGTLLLDEISEMELGLQAKLLRVLQEREVERLGGKKVIPLDVRVLATSNRELQDEVASGKFREDLYYRINVFPLAWLPLKSRRLDIIPLAEHLLARFASECNRPTPSLNQEAKDYLLAYDWPGNVREMGNVMQRALILNNSDEIDATDLLLPNAPQPCFTEAEPTSASQKKANAESLGADLKMREYEVILQTMRDKDNNRQQVADSLGISPRTLRYKLAKMREHGIDV